MEGNEGEMVVLLEEEPSTQQRDLHTRESKEFLVRLEDGSDLGGANHRRSVSLWLSDSLLLLIEHLQLFALILSMSLSWPWPFSWIQGTSIALFFNLDFWEFAKIRAVYQGQAHAFEDPNSIPFNYGEYAAAWLFAVILLPTLFATLYVIVPHIPLFGPLHVFLLRARTVRVFLIVTQVLCLPFGLVMIRLFDCKYYTDLGGGQRYRSTVLRDADCWSSEHLAILIPLFVASIPYFIVLPSWMICKIREELISPAFCTYRTWRTHETHLRVKETEYLQGLDIAWAINHYSIFSSFRRPWVWFRALSFFLKGFILILYGALFYALKYQAIVIFGVVGIVLFAVILIPVYRLHTFNIMLAFSIVVNLCNLLLGVLLVLEVQNALLVGQNLINALVIINTVWLFSAIVWFIYLVLRNSILIRSKCRPLWPILPELDNRNKFHSEHTEKFIRSILQARRLCEKCYSLPEFFAPVHELSRQIQIINAYCREAELLDDPTHGSLWTLLAEMVDLHSALAPYSIFGTSTKETLTRTVHELLSLMPEFRKRLDQREYDLILWTPMKRRMLLKLLAVATFINGRTARVRFQIDTRDSSAKRDSHVSRMTFLHDYLEETNDNLLLDIEKWEQARRASVNVHLAVARKPSLDQPSHLSSSSLLTNDAFIKNVEVWEQARQLAVKKPKTLHRSSNGASHLSTTSLQRDDAFLRDVDKWERDRRASLETSSILSTSRGVKSSHRSTSKLSVRFNLDTISEIEDQTRPSSSENTDAFIDSIDKQFPA